MKTANYCFTKITNMKSTLLFTLFTALILPLAVISQEVQETSQDKVLRAEIQENFKGIGEAMAAGDPELVATHWTEDALIKFPGQKPLWGRDAIAREHQKMLDMGIVVKPKTLEVERLGKMAYEIGEYEVLDLDGNILDSGTYASIWKKVDGEWKIYRDVISSNGSAK